jgi:hypothetical protein
MGLLFASMKKNVLIPPYCIVVILNTDGKTFTLLENPQAMRLKKAGYSK